MFNKSPSRMDGILIPSNSHYAPTTIPMPASSNPAKDVNSQALKPPTPAVQVKNVNSQALKPPTPAVQVKNVNSQALKPPTPAVQVKNVNSQALKPPTPAVQVKNVNSQALKPPTPAVQVKNADPIKKERARDPIHAGFRFQSPTYSYKLEDLIGDGGYGRVYEAQATPKTKQGDTTRLAIKIEPRSTSTTAIEAQVLRTALEQKCRRIPRILDSGTIPDLDTPHTFIAMERKGRDLYQLKKEQRDNKFSLGTALRIGIEALEALRELHELCGYISRDVKPGNFVTGQPTNDDFRHVFMIDFGLCRRYRDAQNNLIPSRGEIGWRGTNRYGSIQAHLRKDLARRDDIESWFYMLVELIKGQLPWATLRERPDIHNSKLEARKPDSTFLQGCPEQFGPLLKTIDELGFTDVPNYAAIERTLEEILEARQLDRTQPMDWEHDGRQEDTGDARTTSATATTERQF